MEPEKEKHSRLQEHQHKLFDSPEVNTQVPEKTGIICCPECGSSRIRKRGKYFFISLAIFIGLLLLNKIMAVGYTHGFWESNFKIGLGLVLVVICHFWPAIICGAACFAFVGKHRCLSCGYRFQSVIEKKSIQNEILFPWRFSILNGAMIFLILVFSGNIYMLKSHFSLSMLFSVLVFNGIFAAFPTAFFIILSLIYQLIIYRFLRARIKSFLLWAILFLAPAIALGGDLFYKHIPKVAANRILAHGELAQLPAYATEIKVYTWSTPMSGEEFLRFSATADDIKVFLESSPILKNKECQKYSKDKMRVPFSEDFFNNVNFSEEFPDPNEYFNPDPQAPDWYIEELRGAGRRYNIKPKGYHYPGEVIIDDEKNIVFICLCFS
jgi:hypothetical protein